MNAASNVPASSRFGWPRRAPASTALALAVAALAVVAWPDPRPCHATGISPPGDYDFDTDGDGRNDLTVTLRDTNGDGRSDQVHFDLDRDGEVDPNEIVYSNVECYGTIRCDYGFGPQNFIIKGDAGGGAKYDARRSALNKNRDGDCADADEFFETSLNVGCPALSETTAALAGLTLLALGTMWMARPRR